MSGGVQNNGLPAHWHWKTIGEVARTQSGGTPDRHRSDYFGGNVRWVKSGELRDGFVASTEETLSQEGVAESSAKLFPAGTLCIALYGATVGKVGILTTDAATNQAVCGIRVPDHVDTRFLFHYLIYVRPSLIQRRKGGAQGNISNSLVRKTDFPCPPLDEQQRIVAKIEELFSDLDAGVAALERVQANLQRYRASVLKAAVEGRLTQQWRAEHPDVEPADQLLQRILRERREKWEQDQLAKYEAKGKKPPKNWKDKYKEPAAPDTTNLPELPKGWYWATVEQLSDQVVDCPHSTPKFSEPGHPCVDTTCIRPAEIVYQKLRYVDNYTYNERIKRLQPKPGDIIFAREGTIGTAVLIPESFYPCLGQRVMVLRPNSHISAQYFTTALNSWAVKSQFAGKILGTTAPHMNVGEVKCLAVPLPPTKEQSQVTKMVEDQLSIVSAVESSLQTAKYRSNSLRQAILKRAFEGNLLNAETKTAAAG